MSQSVTHIVHIVHGFHIGGLEKLIVNCINQMGNGYRHTIISLTTVGSIIEQIKPEITAIALNKPPGNSLRIYLDLFRQLRQLQPDVVQTYNLATIEYQCVAALARVPVRVHAEHGRDSYDPNGAVKKYRYLRKICAAFIHQIVAVSDDLYQWLAHDVGIAPKKLKLIRNGINTHYFKPVDKPASPTVFTFGHVARLQSIKNQQMLISAYQAACRQDPDFSTNTQLVLVGDGDQRQQLQQLASRYEAECHITFAGSQADVRQYYGHFDTFVLSSIAEGIPLTLLESMSMGIPHIVTKVGGISEVIVEGCTGVTVPSQNHQALTAALLQFYHHRTQLTTMGDAARSRIEQSFSETAMVGEYTKLYQYGV
ncbi:glycosyl transferase group 1 protein [Photobacterium gaetbulicola]|uniref:Putative glycosyl transferase, group 1 n=1 Tax=Photobacterium gaetbulicola Gung47 TaxID=658445 RepID=A0A0C5WPJ3_9GAMM|nr:glycosyltransferase [Photobacterium gaetbulicola]AJR09058.1 putative glycosyl transferase, group 1 [Photobacterium gaetbulicola Gung47]PSU04822.1 glycosyl transferase group 1 protein [Photobacterium gaetbulicola]